MFTGNDVMQESHSTKRFEDRRKSPRLLPAEVPALKSVQLSTGPVVRVVNISRDGVLVEGDTRLQPSSSVCLRLMTTTKVVLIRGRVLRSIVSEVRSHAKLRYESAITFYDNVQFLIEEISRREVAESDLESQPVYADPSVSVAVPAMPGAANPTETSIDLVVTASISQSFSELSRLFGANEW